MIVGLEDLLLSCLEIDPNSRIELKKLQPILDRLTIDSSNPLTQSDISVYKT